MARLEALYDRVPNVKCKGHCQKCCTGIGMSRAEWRRMLRRGGPLGPPPRKLEDGGVLTTEAHCRYLTADGRCGVYDVRPMVCRLWGASESMPCPWGCEVEGGPLKEPEGMVLLQEAMVAGGGTGPGGDEIRKRWEEDPEYRDFIRDFMRAAYVEEYRRMRGENPPPPDES